MMIVLDTGGRQSHQEFTGCASPALNMTIGDLKECGDDLTCARGVQGQSTPCAKSAAGVAYEVAPGAAVKSVKVWKAAD